MIIDHLVHDVVDFLTAGAGHRRIVQFFSAEPTECAVMILGNRKFFSDRGDCSECFGILTRNGPFVHPVQVALESLDVFAQLVGGDPREFVINPYDRN